jgi:outer membrane protein assembly factor BamA
MKAALALVPSSLGYWLLPLLLLSAAANALSPDSLVVVNEVRLEGNRRTREHIIRRELDVQPGDTLTVTDTAAVLRRNRNKIFNTDLFVTVDVVLKPVGAGRADLVIQLRERWYLFPSLIFELADRNFNEWWYDRNHDLGRTNYGVRLSHKNVRGRAERLRGTAQFGFTRRFEVAYEVPYLDRSLTYGLGVSFAYAQTKDLAYRSAENRLVFLDSEQQLRERWEGRLSLRRRFRFYAFHALDARFFASRIADTIAQLNPDYFLAGRTRQRYLSLGYSFTYDRRDVAAYPLHGYLINTELLRSGLLPDDDLNQWALRVRLARYGAVSRRWFWGGGFAGPYLSAPATALFASAGSGIYSNLGARLRTLPYRWATLCLTPFFAALSSL